MVLIAALFTMSLAAASFERASKTGSMWSLATGWLAISLTILLVTLGLLL